MFGIGLTEIIIILIVALLVVGPKKLPELAKTLGRGLAEFRRTADDFKESIYQDEDSLASDRQKSDPQRQVSKIPHSEEPSASASSGESGENRDNETTLAGDQGENKSPEAGS